MTTTKHQALMALAVSLTCASAVARADTLSDLKEQTETLQRKVTELENARQKAASNNAVTGGSIPGSFKLPGSDTSIKLGGYVKLDAIFSNITQGVDAVANQQTVDSAIPVGPNGSPSDNKKGQLTFHARQTRLNLATSTPTSYGDLTTFIEGDFFGTDGNESVTNSNGFRIRHAYGSLGNFSAGQYWTNFFNEQAYPETLDFGGAVGEIFIRQAQVRWTQKFSGGDWSVSAESPESVLAVPGSATPFRSDSDHAPDFTGRVKFAARGASYSLGLLGRNMHVDSASAPAATSGKWGGAIAFVGIVPTTGRDDVRFDVNAGNAIGRYQVPGFLPDGYVDANGRVQLARQESGFIAYRHFWTPTLRSTLELSATSSRPPAATFNGIN